KLFGTWLALRVGFAGDIECTFTNPIRFGWSAVDLTALHLPGEFDEVVDSVFRKEEVTGSSVASLQCVRRGRLDGGDFKRRVRGRGHRGQRYGAWELPHQVRSGEHESQRIGLLVLRPGPRDRLAIRAQLALKADAENILLDLQIRGLEGHRQRNAGWVVVDAVHDTAQGAIVVPGDFDDSARLFRNRQRALPCADDRLRV